jgi:undecaprenyl-diphosphatase
MSTSASTAGGSGGHPEPEGRGCRRLEPRPESISYQLEVRADESHHPALVPVELTVTAYLALTALFLAVGTAINHLWVPSALGHGDDWVSRWLAAHRTPVFDHVTALATFMANTFQVVGVAAVVGAVLLLVHRWREALLLAVSLVLEVTVFLSVTYVVGRPRPDVPRLDSTPSTASFPSGHIAASLVLWGAIALCIASLVRWRAVRVAAWCVAVVIPVMIGFARVYRGMHHLTDVIAGALLGAGALTAGILVVRVTSVVAERRSEHHDHSLEAAEVLA